MESGEKQPIQRILEVGGSRKFRDQVLTTITRETTREVIRQGVLIKIQEGGEDFSGKVEVLATAKAVCSDLTVDLTAKPERKEIPGTSLLVAQNLCIVEVIPQSILTMRRLEGGIAFYEGQITNEGSHSQTIKIKTVKCTFAADPKRIFRGTREIAIGKNGEEIRVSGSIAIRAEIVPIGIVPQGSTCTLEIERVAP